MAVYLPIRAISRSQNIRIGGQTITTTTTAFVDISDPETLTELHHHQAIGAIIPVGPLSSNNAANKVVEGLKVSEGSNPADMDLAATAGEVRKDDGTYVKGLADTSITVDTAPDPGYQRIDLVSFHLADSTFVVTKGTEVINASITITEETKGDDDPATNEVQEVTLNEATGGTFTLTFDDTGSNPQTTGVIAYNATAASVATALKALSNIGDSDVGVTGSAGGPYTVTFQGALGNQDVRMLTATSSLTPDETPVAPATPTGDVPLATVAVAESVTAIVNANITDIRPVTSGNV